MPARYPNCCTAIFSFGRRNPLIAVLRFFSYGRRNPSIATPQLFFFPAQYPDCRAANFSFGQRNPSIAAPQFFQLAGAIPQLPFDCCFLALRPFAAIALRPALRQPLVQSSSLAPAIWRNPQASCQPFGTILKPCASHSVRYTSLVPAIGAISSFAPAIVRNIKASRWLVV